SDLGPGRTATILARLDGGSIRKSGAMSAAAASLPLAERAAGGRGLTKTAVAQGNARAFLSAQPPSITIAPQIKKTFLIRSALFPFVALGTWIPVPIRRRAAVRCETSCRAPPQ